MLAALREADGRADRDRRVGEALAVASEPPLEIARTAAEVGVIALGIAVHASSSVRGDVITSAVLAEAAARSAAALVEINLYRSPGDERVAAAGAAAEQAAAARERVLG